MITKDDIKTILRAVKDKWPKATKRDIAFALLCDTVADRKEAYNLVFGAEPLEGMDAYLESEGMHEMFSLLKTFGIGVTDESLISREENKAELIKMIPRITEAAKRGEIDNGYALKLEADLRVKLNDKFDMEASERERRIIIVPQKHDYICPHTGRECSSMPSKEACMEYYKLH